jgi:hypothetical protein
MFSKKLAAELGLPVFVTMANIKWLVDELNNYRAPLKIALISALRYD